MFETYPDWKWWFKTTDFIRNTTWYTCRFCMTTGANSTANIRHHEHCNRPDMGNPCEDIAMKPYVHIGPYGENIIDC